MSDVVSILTQAGWNLGSILAKGGLVMVPLLASFNDCSGSDPRAAVSSGDASGGMRAARRSCPSWWQGTSQKPQRWPVPHSTQ